MSHMEFIKLALSRMWLKESHLWSPALFGVRSLSHASLDLCGMAAVGEGIKDNNSGVQYFFSFIESFVFIFF